MLTITKIILVLTLCFDLYLLILITKNFKQVINKFLALNIVGVWGWAFCILLNLWFSNLLIERFIFVFPIIIAVSQIFFIDAFPVGKVIFNLAKKIIVALSILAITICFVPDSLFLNIEINNYGYTVLDSGFFTPYYSIFVFIIFVFPLLVLNRKRKEFKNDKKISVQIKYLFWGYFLSLTISFLANSVLPVFFGVYILNGLGPAFSLIFSGFLFYIISRYNFLDIKIVIQRSLVYSLVFSLISGVYFILLFASGFIFQQITNTEIIAVAFITVLFGSYSLPKIEQYFMRLTDRIFFKDKYDYSEALFSLSQILNRNINLTVLLHKIAKNLKRILRVKHLIIILPERKIFLDDNSRLKMQFSDSLREFIWLVASQASCTNKAVFAKKQSFSGNAAKKMDYDFQKRELLLESGKTIQIAATVPIRLDNRLVGVLALGEKLSGDCFSLDDRNLLRTFSFQAAIALEKAQLYEKVKNYSLELEKKVSERTEEIKNMQEEQKRMMLDIAHGLQTPLTIVKSELKELENGTAEPGRFEALEGMLERISKFIYDMLRLARMENKSNNVKTERFDLSELVLELMESFEIVCAEKSIKIEKNIAPDIFLHGDKNEIAELIMNLVSNSIKYMDEEKEKAILFTLKKNSGKIEMELADTGIGIAEKDLHNLFRRFFRINDSAHAGKSGTGLGLAICKGIVERHGGKIEVESRKGEGTKFVIIFPEAEA